MYFVEKTKGFNMAKQFDYLLFIAVMALSVIGIFVLSSATRVMVGGIDGSAILRKQIISLLLGVAIALVISRVDYKDFKNLGIVMYLISIFLLLIVLFKGTGQELGSRSWLDLPIIGRFQPSEFAKVTFVVVASIFLERLKENGLDMKNVSKLLVYSILPIGLVLAQKDFGTAAVFIFMLFMLLFVCDLPYKYILTMISTFILSMPLLWFFVLNEKRKDRIRVFFNPELDPQGSGYNVLKSKMAIGSGQLYGKGLFQGIQNQNAAVPVKESDFIFTVIGEELGFVGTIIILALILFILLKCIYIARNSRDLYGAFVVIGLTSMLAFHFFENIGMCIGILPVTGIPLPFISQGGTAMVTNFIAVGLILSVSMRQKKVIFNS